MLPFVLGGVAIAATGYRIKKILTNESNLDNINDALIKGIDWLDKVDKKAETFFDGLIEKIDTSKNQEKLVSLLNHLDDIKNTTAKIIYNDLEELLFNATKNSYSDMYKPMDIKQKKDKQQLFLLYSKENYQLIERFCDILTTTNNFLSQYIDELKVLSTHNAPTTRPYSLTQKQIKKLYKLQISLENVIYCPISIDNVTISMVAKRSFNKIKHTIELF